MARQPRLVVPGYPHYVLQRAVHGQQLAQDDADRRTLVKIIGATSAALAVQVWAYALEAGCLHLLVTPGHEDGLSRMMQTIGRRYVAAFNRRHGRTGALWGARFESAVIEPSEWLLTVMTMIDGILSEDSTWSSRFHRIGRVRDPLVKDPPQVWTLGNTPFEREQGYRDRLQEGVSTGDSDRIVRALRGGWAVGSDEFVAKISTLAGRPAAPRARGRPRQGPKCM